jgi:hypothetical protein
MFKKWLGKIRDNFLPGSEGNPNNLERPGKDWK